MEQQLTHIQQYVGSIDPQIQQRGVDPQAQALSQQSIGQVNPQSTGQQTIGQINPQSMSQQSIGQVNPQSMSQQSIGQVNPQSMSQQSIGQVNPQSMSQQTIGQVNPQSMSQQTIGQVNPQSMSQQTIGQVDPQSLNQQHRADNQPMSRNVELLPLSVPMDSHASMSVSIDHHSVAMTMTSSTVSSAINTHPMTSAIDSQSRPLDSQVMQGQQFMARTIDSHHQIIAPYNTECIDRQNITGPMNHKHSEHHMDLGSHSDLLNISNSIEMQIQNQQHNRTLDVPHHLSGNNVMQHLGQHVQFQGHMGSGMAQMQPQPMELVSNINTVQEIDTSNTVQHSSVTSIDHMNKQPASQISEPHRLTVTFQQEPASTPTQVVTNTVTQSLSVPAVNNLSQVSEKPAVKEYIELVTRLSSKDSAAVDNTDIDAEQTYTETDKTHDVSFYRKAMKSLCEKMSLAGEESMVLTATLADGKVNKFGSKLGMMFLNGNNAMLDGFLTFCKDQFHAEVQDCVPDASETVSVPEKKKRNRKKKEIVEEQPFTKIVKRNDKKSEEKTPIKTPDKPARTSSRKKKPARSKSPTPETTPKPVESDNDDNDFMHEMDDGGDSDYDISKEVSSLTDEEIKEESAEEEDDKPVTRSKRRKLQAKPQKKQLKTSKKGKKLSVQISKLKMKISSDKKKAKDNQSDQAGQEKQEESSDTSRTTSSLQCEYCQTKFNTAAEVKSHKHKYHEDLITRQKSDPVGFGKKRCSYKFTCIDCNTSFKNRYNLKAHMEYYSDIHDFMCQDCGKTFLREKDLEKHSLTHSKVKPFKCDRCFKMFKTNEGRKLHYINFHGPKSSSDDTGSDKQFFLCLICGGKYSSKSALQKHELAHERDYERKERLEALVDFSSIDQEERDFNQTSKEDSQDIKNADTIELVLDAEDVIDDAKLKDIKLPHECDECGKKFPTSRDLKTHKNGHEKGKASYECDLCKRVFLTRISLYRHRQIHTRSGKYTCRICKKQYASLDYLIKHGKLHNAEPPFKCDVCQKGFHEKRYMQYHLATHTKEKPYMCDQCGRTFRTPQQQKDHAMTHSDERPHSCDICGKSFKLRDTLRVHKQTHETALNFMCGTCGRRFNRAYNLRKHEKVHMDLPAYICKDCGKACKTPVSLKSHWISFHLKPEDVANCKYTVWQCEVCFKPFAERMDRDVHMRTHTGEKPYSCEYCGKAFADKSNLRAHVRNHEGDKSKTCNICGKGFTFNRDLKKHVLTHSNSTTGTHSKPRKKVLQPVAPVVVTEAPVNTDAIGMIQQVWSDTPHQHQHQQEPQQRLAFHQEAPRMPELQHTTTVVEASAEALSAAYALTMAREASMQQMANPQVQTSEYTWQYL